MPVREFARVTGRSPGTVGNLLRRAAEKLESPLVAVSTRADFLAECDDHTGSWQRADPDSARLVPLNRHGWTVRFEDGETHLCALAREREAFVGWCDCKGFEYNSGPCAHLCALRKAEFIHAKDVDDERVRIPEATETRAVADGGRDLVGGGHDGQTFGRPEGQL